MGADLHIVVLPADDDTMHAAVDQASTTSLAEFVHNEWDEPDEAIWDAASRGGFPTAGVEYIDAEHVERALRRNPGAIDSIRTYLHAAITDGPGRCGVITRVAGVEVMLAGGMSSGDGPYDGFTAHCVLERFLDHVGAGVPSQAATPPAPA
jgi:hypothetical protein